MRGIAVPLIASVLSGALYALSFPPVSCTPLAWIALVPFLIVVSTMRPRMAAGWGLVLGLTGALGLAWWLPDMIATYFAVSPAIGWLGTFAAVTVLVASYCAVFAAWVAWAAARGGAGPFVVAAAWIAVEFARANLLGGNPLGLIAYSQVRWLRLMQIADATGPYGVGFLVAATNACVAGLLAPRLRARHPVRSFAVLATAMGAALVYGTWRLAQPMATGEPVTVAVVQDAVARDARRRPEVRAAALDRYLALTENAASARPAVVFWPENAVDFNLQDASADRARVTDTTRALDVDLILGGPAYTWGEAGLRHYNSVFLVRQGRVAGRYDKNILLPFAERAPRGALEAGYATSGLRSRAGIVGTFVCLEALYPAFVRRLAAGGAEVLANLSNDAWFGWEAPAQHQLDVASVRAIENRRYLVRATTTGFSAVIDPYGREVARTGRDTVEVLTEPIRRSRVRTPYQSFGDVAAWAMVALVIVASLGPIASTRKGGRS